MIQIITGSYYLKNRYQEDKYVISDFKSPKSFDLFDINILDLSFDKLWENFNADNTINMLKDLKHYFKIIETTKQAKILVLFPQNIKFKSNYYSGGYHSEEDLKNMLEFGRKLIKENINSFNFSLNFENTITSLGNTQATADFYFDKEYLSELHTVLISDKSCKITTIKVDDRLYYTTLNLRDFPQVLEEFLIKSKILTMCCTERPAWIENIDILDDSILKEKIASIDELIKEKELEKNNELIKLEKNNEIKSILYETDKKLQNQVIEILNEILEYEDDNFVDEMEEDFRIKKDDVTFIIETKGLSRNVKGTDIDKTFNHVLMYEETLEEGVCEEVKGVFIVTTQREKNIVEREKIPDRQIIIAKQLKILIIRTEELLKLFVAFRNKKISTEEIMKQFKYQIGEYKYNEEK